MSVDPYTIGSEHQIGLRRYTVTSDSSDEVVWLRSVDTDIEMPVSRTLLFDCLINPGPILDRLVDEYAEGRYSALPMRVREG